MPTDAPFLQRVKKFQEEVEQLETKYKIYLGHEDSHGAFLYFDDTVEEGWTVYTYPEATEVRRR